MSLWQEKIIVNIQIMDNKYLKELVEKTISII